MRCAADTSDHGHNKGGGLKKLKKNNRESTLSCSFSVWPCSPQPRQCVALEGPRSLQRYAFECVLGGEDPNRALSRQPEDGSWVLSHCLRSTALSASSAESLPAWQDFETCLRLRSHPSSRASNASIHNLRQRGRPAARYRGINGSLQWVRKEVLHPFQFVVNVQQRRQGQARVLDLSKANEVVHDVKQYEDFSRVLALQCGLIGVSDTNLGGVAQFGYPTEQDNKIVN